ncbi:copper amine oxidase N-terminal domain-containing protein [bacterium LRH843]|nr:copper amine oxidase N-terminal domain-containing protein [bacterium LRH843]
MRAIYMKSTLAFMLLFSVFLPISAEGATNSNEEKLLLLVNTRQYYQNGVMHLAQAPHLVKDGVTYVSMRSLAERLGYKVYYEAATNEYVMEEGNDKLSFKLKGKTYRYNGETMSIRSGEIHTLNGSLMIPLRETVTPLNMKITSLGGNKIEITWKKKETLEPVFTPLEVAILLDKMEYKIGEQVTYREAVSGGSGKIKDMKWSNNEPAFFTSGPKKVTLQVTDANGEIVKAEATVHVTDEVLRTKEQYEALFTPIGEKITVGGSVLTYPTIPYAVKEEDYPLIRSNSPERITRDGIYYEDSLKGNARVLIHKLNERKAKGRVYLVARNISDTPATVELTNLGVGGPNQYVASNGKESLSSYYRSFTNFEKETATIDPGRVHIFAEEKISKPIPEGFSLTVYADVYSDQEVLYQVVVLEEMNEFSRVYPFLTGVTPTRDGRHTRGTFEKGNRTLSVDALIGVQRERLVLGDGVVDRFVTGYDNLLDNNEEINYGNRGVLYTMKLNRVAPNTALVLNPRGGQYSGSFLVNGKVVMIPNTGTLTNQDEAVVLYRTGSREEQVTIQFIPASGSNLPLNLVTIPLEKR